MRADAAFYFLDPAEKWARPQPASAHGKGLAQLTLFSGGRRYGVLIFDEAHNVRTYGAQHIGATELRHAAFMTLALTATPVMTSPQASGRLRTPINHS